MNEPTPPEDITEDPEETANTVLKIDTGSRTVEPQSFEQDHKDTKAEENKLLERMRNDLKETRTYDRSLVVEVQRRHDQNQIPQSLQSKTQSEPIQTTPKWKLPLVGLGRALDSLPYAAMIISQMGAVHPWRTNGRWEWVIEPWARIKDNPGKGPPGDWEKYTDMFLEMKVAGKKTVNFKTLGGENPNIKLDGLGGVVLLDSRRVRGAQAAGVRIVANVNRA